MFPFFGERSPLRRIWDITTNIYTPCTTPTFRATTTTTTTTPTTTTTQPKPVATPSIKVVTKNVLFWDGGTTPKRVKVELAVNPPEFDGQVTLAWDNDARVHKTQKADNALTNGGVLDPQHWRAGAPVFVEPRRAGDVTLTLTLSTLGSYQAITASVSEAVPIQELTLAITDEEESTAPYAHTLAPNPRKYKAVLTPAVGYGNFAWKATLPKTAIVNLAPANAAVVKMTPKDQGSGKVTLEVKFTHEGRSLTKTHEVTVHRLVVKDEGGSNPAKKHAIVGKVGESVDVARKFEVVVEPAHEVQDIAWSVAAGGFSIPGATDETTVAIEAATTGAARIRVKGKLDGDDDRNGSGEHPFTIVDPAIEHATKGTLPEKVLIERKQKYKAVPAGATVAWSTETPLAVLTGANAETVEVCGTEVTTDGKGPKLGMTYALDGQKVARAINIKLATISVTSVAVAVDRSKVSGTPAEIEVKGRDGTTAAWTLTAKPNDAAIDGASNKEKLTVKATKPGVVTATVKCTDTELRRDLTDKGTIVFVGERIKSLTAERRTKKNLAANAKATDKTVEVLLGLARDPDVWKIGHIVAEAEGAPVDDVDGFDNTAGKHAWTPKAGSYLEIAVAQPTDHGADKAAVLLLARPKSGNKGPPPNPGKETVKQAAEAAFTRFGQEAKDAFEVTVHRYGCSEIKWQRKGLALTEADKIDVCPHRANTQWSGKPNWLKPPGGTEPGIVDIVEPGGHQHGGRCAACSGAANENTGASPRHVWHHVRGGTDTFDAATALADEIRAYALDENANTGAYSLFLTQELRDYVRPGNKASCKMLGVLRGYDAFRQEVWLYALSGDWAASDEWSKPLNLGGQKKTQRTITGYSGTSVTYRKAQAPFNTNVFGDGWGKLGRCAAPALLTEAIAQGLEDLELTEVWVDVNDVLKTTTTFKHKHEIGSCEQCRRILGGLLCEIG